MLAFDSNVFIYMLEGSGDFSEAAKNALRPVLEGRVQGCVSVLVITEVISGKQGTDISFITDAPFSVAGVDTAVATLAGQLRQQHKSLKTADAIHLATAKHAGAKQFITNNARLYGVKAGLDIVPLAGFKEAG